MLKRNEYFAIQTGSWSMLLHVKTLARCM